MLKKDITFIYLDSAQKSAYQPIADEAEKRGYKVRMTDNPYERCEIAFYCEHKNYPQYSKFSVIMLHDIIQQYSNWPNIWYNEPWHKYDVGVLPSNQWEENWKQSSHFYYTRPRQGVYKIGWPKADKIAKLQAATYREDFYREHGLDVNKKTILYAPAWENDGKQDDFVQAMLKLDVNIVIKQADWNPTLYPEQVKNVREMAELHKNVERVTILPPVTNIFEAIAVSDILVSEESSTMCEAVMMGVPAVAVSDWLIPDVTPSRYPKCDYDFVFPCKKDELTDTIRKMTENYEEYQSQAQRFSEKNFSNIGQVSTMVMDIIDDCVNGAPIRYEQIQPSEIAKISAKDDLRHKVAQWKNEVVFNYAVQYPAVGAMFRCYKKVKNAVLGK